MGKSSTRQARLADAGLLVAQGSSVKQALIQQGYAESTARNPQRNGIAARQCLDAAAKEYPDAVPQKILQRARRAMGQKLAQWNDNPAALNKAKGGEVARMVDVVERWYGTHAPGNPSDRLFADRLATFAGAVEEAKRRGLLDDAGQLVRRRTIEAKPVDPPTDTGEGEAKPG